MREGALPDDHVFNNADELVESSFREVLPISYEDLAEIQAGWMSFCSFKQWSLASGDIKNT